MCKILEKFCSLDETFGYVRFNINESLGKGKKNDTATCRSTNNF